MKTITLEHNICELIVLPDAILVGTNIDEYTNDPKKRINFLVRNYQVSRLSHLDSGRVFWRWWSEGLVLGWDSGIYHEDMKYLNENIECVPNRVQAFALRINPNYVTFSISPILEAQVDDESRMSESQKIIWHSLTQTKKDSNITIFVNTSTQENKTFTWDKPYSNFVPSHDELTFIGYYEKELVIIDNPFEN